jgi:3-oxoacyl-[acyl-carrier protein] reductase
MGHNGLLENKAAIITGAARGIGFGMARVFLREGASVVLADLDAKELEAAWQMLVAEFGPDRVVRHALDVASESSAEASVQYCVEAFGGIDVLVNNAGIVSRGYVNETPLAEWDRVLKVNLSGVYVCCRAAIPAMRRRGGGAILNASSVSARMPDAGLSAYCVSKAGVETFTRVLAAEAAPYRIRVNAYAPGVTRTPMTEDILAARAEQKLRHISLRQFGDPDDIANLAAFLCSERARFITGAVMAVDGGTMIVEHPWKPWDHTVDSGIAGVSSST